MKSEKQQIKKQIKARVELRKQTKMGIRDKLRTSGTPPKPIPVDLVGRNERRRDNRKINPIKYLPLLQTNEPISIIITAYQTQDFIEECLNSIKNQTYFENNYNYEILVGVDNCEETLKKLNEIHHNYRNLKIFMMKKNLGTYITTNTLLEIVKYENIIRFDSDDVMKLEMINEIMYLINDFDVIRLKYTNFYNLINMTQSGQGYANGAIFYKRKIIEMFGGYMPWRCAADFELIKRMSNHVNFGKTERLVFYRRRHDNALTKKSKTKMGSKYRNELLDKIKDEYGVDEIKIKQLVNNYYKI